jgi:hypothetical protein
VDGWLVTELGRFSGDVHQNLQFATHRLFPTYLVEKPLNVRWLFRSHDEAGTELAAA